MRLSKDQWLEEVREYALQIYGYDVTEGDDDFIKQWREENETPKDTIERFAEKYKLIAWYRPDKSAALAALRISPPSPASKYTYEDIKTIIEREKTELKDG